MAFGSDRVYGEKDERTFRERVKRVNMAWLINVPVERMDDLAQKIEDALNEAEAKLVTVKMSSNRMFIDTGGRD